jgi:[ribosomal protein S5]-alanine N-acetyltransferase
MTASSISAFTMMPAAVATACQDPEALTEQQARGLDRPRVGMVRRRRGGMVADRETGDAARPGQIGIQFESALRRAEAFYWVEPDARGMGIATEALSLVTEWAYRDHDIIRVHLVTHLSNTASQKVAEPSGFQREGVLRAWEPVKGAQPDVVMWSRVRKASAGPEVATDR